MQSVVLAFIFFLITTITTTVIDDFDGLTVIIATLLGFVLGRVNHLQSEVNSLRTAMANDWEQRHQPIIKTSPPTTKKDTNITKTLQQAANQKETTPKPDRHAKPKDQQIPPSFSLIQQAISFVKRYFTGGNLFVRIGILILFFGVSFLLKYAADQGVFPIEYRLMSIAAAAFGLLLFGWLLRPKKKTYGLLLQGAGVGLLYLDTFSAFSLYHLIAPLPAFSLLFIISLLAAALAILQNSRSLAIVGFTGGFLAPILASSGANHYIGLFSYYLILNLAIVAIAWFKAWRELNLLGFLFTFVVGAMWGHSTYQTENFATVESFLIIFFLLYVVIAILFTLRQPEKLLGYVDGSLLFGVPLAASSLQYALVENIEYGISLSSFAIGVFYLLLAGLIWKKAGNTLRLLSEAFLALGIIFTSLTFPFALAPTHSAAAWALEGLGLLWLGSRQNRLSVRIFGLLLQAGASVFVIDHFIPQLFSTPIGIPFLNAAFISVLMITLAGILSARLLALDFQGRKRWERSLSSPLLVWGLAWLFLGTLYQIAHHIATQWLMTGFILLASSVSLLFMLSALRTKPQWQQAKYVAIALLPALLISTVIQSDTVFSLTLHDNYPFRNGGWLAWPIAFTVLYFVIFQLDQHKMMTSLQPLMHTLSALLFITMVTWQGTYLLHNSTLSTSWTTLWLALPATLALWFIIKSTHWPIANNRQTYQHYTGSVLAIYLMLWGVSTVTAYGNFPPLPWIPLLNPLDITLAVVLLTLYQGWKSFRPDDLITTITPFTPNKSFFAISIIGLTFLWLNFTLFRLASHWFDVPYTAYALYHTHLVQTAVSVLWALSGVILTLYASRQKMRMVWIAGGILLGGVVLKLFTIDLSSLSSLARIVSFLVVGILLTSIGYFSPLPDTKERPKMKK